MGIGKTNAGGGTSLNFKIIRYDTEEDRLVATPSENTIGIITPKITSWIVSPSEPAEPEEGMLWIVVGNGCEVGFNALKKNAIQLYPLSAKQYWDGVWIAVSAMSYQGGQWNDWWDGWLYELGEIWSGCAYSQALTPSTATVSYEEDHILLKTVGGSASEVYHVIGPQALDDITSITVEGTHLEGGSGSTYTRVATIFVSQSEGDSYKNAAAIASQVKASIAAGTAFTLTLDVESLTGEYYIHVGTNTQGSAWDSVRTLSVSRVYGEFAQ